MAGSDSSFHSFSLKQMLTYLYSTTSEEDTAAKQSEVSLLMDEVERGQTLLLSLEREKVCIKTLFLISKGLTSLGLLAFKLDVGRYASK